VSPVPALLTIAIAAVCGGIASLFFPDAIAELLKSHNIRLRLKMETTPTNVRLTGVLFVLVGALLMWAYFAATQAVQ
jgi:phage shock protein PspC (stress-responsive transcriptional regulator)